MEAVTVEEIEPAGGGNRRELTDALGATRLAVNRYRLAPGERLAGLHAHADQEEVFVVVEGTLTFETLELREDADSNFEADEVAVGAGEAIRFGPGAFQSGKNASTADAVVYALGAPRDTEDLRVPVACPACGRPDRRPVATADGEALTCPDCGDESPVACPECGGADLHARFTADGETPVSVCLNCGAESPAQ